MRPCVPGCVPLIFVPIQKLSRMSTISVNVAGTARPNSHSVAAVPVRPTVRIAWVRTEDRSRQ